MSDDPITSFRFDPSFHLGSYRVYWDGKTIVTFEEMGEPHDHPRQKYEVGETVWLVSGGPPMNVSELGPSDLLYEDWVETCWFDRAGHQHEGIFHVDQLTRRATMHVQQWDAWRRQA